MPKYWFKQKTFGIGATPNSWQGWVLTLVAVALVLIVVLEAQQISDPHIAMLVALSGAAIIMIFFSVITYIKTEGGWRWRSGPDDKR